MSPYISSGIGFVSIRPWTSFNKANKILVHITMYIHYAHVTHFTVLGNNIPNCFHEKGWEIVTTPLKSSSICGNEIL